MAISTKRKSAKKTYRFNKNKTKKIHQKQKQQRGGREPGLPPHLAKSRQPSLPHGLTKILRGLPGLNSEANVAREFNPVVQARRARNAAKLKAYHNQIGTNAGTEFLAKQPHTYNLSTLPSSELRKPSSGIYENVSNGVRRIKNPLYNTGSSTVVRHVENPLYERSPANPEPSTNFYSIL